MNIEELKREIEYLKQENNRLKAGIKHYKRGMYKIICTASECRNSDKWNYKDE